MTPEGKAQLKIDEGFRAVAYPDPLSPLAKARALPLAKRPRGWERLPGDPWTIGYGHTGLGVQPGLEWERWEADMALDTDVSKAERLLDRDIKWWRNLDPVRQDVISSMTFNMGWDNPRTEALEGFAAFRTTLGHIKAGRYAQAAEAMLDSLWARQVGDRAKRLSREMATGRRG